MVIVERTFLDESAGIDVTSLSVSLSVSLRLSFDLSVCRVLPPPQTLYLAISPSICLSPLKSPEIDTRMTVLFGFSLLTKLHGTVPGWDMPERKELYLVPFPMGEGLASQLRIDDLQGEGVFF